MKFIIAILLIASASANQNKPFSLFPLKGIEELEQYMPSLREYYQGSGEEGFAQFARSLLRSMPGVVKFTQLFMDGINEKIDSIPEVAKANMTPKERNAFDKLIPFLRTMKKITDDALPALASYAKINIPLVIEVSERGAESMFAAFELSKAIREGTNSVDYPTSYSVPQAAPAVYTVPNQQGVFSYYTPIHG